MLKFKSSKWSILLTALIMITGLFTSTFSMASEAAGDVYTGEAQGHNGPLTVEVVVTEEAITDIQVVDHSESAGIADPAIERIPAQLVEQQSLDVDTVAGATVTSQAIIEATEAALAESGLDLSVLLAAVPAGDEEEASDTVEEIEMETQVLVIGGGIAGISAALEAADNGAQVMLIEKMPALGGSTIRSGGEILAAESPHQEAFGVEDSAEDFAEYLIEVGEGGVDEEFIRYIADHSGENIQWLMDNGVVFIDGVFDTHSTIAYGRRHIAEEGGAGIILPLEEQMAERGVEVLKSTPAISLIEENGEVVGAMATNDEGDEITILADAVILATGGYTRNEELMAQYHPTHENYSINTGEGNTGDGIIMGEELGAELIMPDGGIDLAVNPHTYFGYGEEAKGLFVSPEGERFMDESRFHFQRSRIMNEMKIDNVWYIFDETVYDERVQLSIDDGFAFEADTVEELAELTGMDSTVLLETVEEYNRMAEAGEDEDFNKDPEFMTPITEGKFYAANLMTGNSGSHGGLKITLDGEVVDTNGDVIPGLYAAGEVSSGQILNIGYPGSGTAIISYLTIGRNAGQAAADYLVAE